MFKYLRFVGLFLLAVILSSAPAGQTELSTLMGPATFARGTGEPVTEVRQFSSEGFSAPFILHLRNGNEDGTNRASSASVWLNGTLIFGPRHFSQQAWAYDIEVDLLPQNTLELRLASEPGSVLTVWIDGSSTESPEVKFTPGNEVSELTAAIGPGGFTYVFSDGGPLDGVSVEFPPNALDDVTEVVNVKYFSHPCGKDISQERGKDISHPCGKQISHPPSE